MATNGDNNDNGSSNNNNSDNNNNKIIRLRKLPPRYNIPRRELQKREIRRLLIEEGLTNRQICERLNIPSRTFDRYLHEIYAYDNQLLIAPSIEDAATFANVFIEKLSQQRQELIKDIIRNPTTTAMDKIEAHHLAAEMARVSLLMTQESPQTLARQLPQSLRPGNNNRFVQEQRGLNLTVVTKKPLPQQQLPIPTTAAEEEETAEGEETE